MRKTKAIYSGLALTRESVTHLHFGRLEGRQRRGKSLAVKNKKGGFSCALTGDAVGLGKLESDIPGDSLGEHICLFLIDPTLWVGTKIREVVSY